MFDFTLAAKKKKKKNTLQLYLNWHTSAVETLREEDPLAQHAFIWSSKFNLWKREGVSQVKTAIHIGVGHTAHEFRVLFVKIYCIFVLFDGRSVGFEHFCWIPHWLSFGFQRTESIALSSLHQGGIIKTSQNSENAQVMGNRLIRNIPLELLLRELLVSWC